MRPKPWHVAQAPSGLLKEKRFGVGLAEGAVAGGAVEAVGEAQVLPGAPPRARARGPRGGPRRRGSACSSESTRRARAVRPATRRSRPRRDGPPRGRFAPSRREVDRLVAREHADEAGGARGPATRVGRAPAVAGVRASKREHHPAARRASARRRAGHAVGALASHAPAAAGAVRARRPWPRGASGGRAARSSCRPSSGCRARAGPVDGDGRRDAVDASRPPGAPCARGTGARRRRRSRRSGAAPRRRGCRRRATTCPSRRRR